MRSSIPHIADLLPYVVELNKARLPAQHYQIVGWCLQTFGECAINWDCEGPDCIRDARWDYMGFKFYFKTKSDAALFKLAWL